MRSLNALKLKLRLSGIIPKMTAGLNAALGIQILTTTLDFEPLFLEIFAVDRATAGGTV